VLRAPEGEQVVNEPGADPALAHARAGVVGQQVFRHASPPSGGAGAASMRGAVAQGVSLWGGGRET